MNKRIENIRQVLSFVTFAIFLIIGAFIFVDKQYKKNRANELMEQYRKGTLVEATIDSDLSGENELEQENVDSDKKEIIDRIRNENNSDIVNPAKATTRNIIEENLTKETFYDKILSLKKEDNSWDNKMYNEMLLEFANDIKENHNCNKFYWKNEKNIYNLLNGTKFLGDSNAYHIARFNIIPGDYIGIMRGKSTTEQLNLVGEKIDGTEKNLVFWNGYNIKYFDDANAFVESYKDLIDKIHTINSDCNVYICSLLQATERIVEDDLKSDFVHNIYRGPEYDEGLEKYFGDDYIDTKMFLFSEDQYQDDGVHLNSDYSKMLVSYVAFYVNRDKNAIDENKIEETVNVSEEKPQELLDEKDQLAFEENENTYYENKLFDEKTVDYRIIYSFKNLELLYQYREFMKYFNSKSTSNYYSHNKEFVKKLFDDVCFIGDSQVLRLERLKFLDKEHTVSFGGVKLSDITEKIDEGKNIDIKKFKAIVLWNGYNLKYVKDAEEYVEEYKKLIKAVRKHNKTCDIYISSLLPAEESAVEIDLANGAPHNFYRGPEYDQALMNEFGDHYINTKTFINNNYDDATHMLESFYNSAVSYIGFYVNFMKLKKEGFKEEEHILEAEKPSNKSKELYMTFDDGPSKSTSKLLDILKENDVKATFFLTYQSPKHFENVKRIQEEGHTIAVHTYSHDFSIYSSEASYFEDLFQMESEIYKQIGTWSNIIRFPGGSGNASSKEYKKGIMKSLTKLVEDMGYVYYDWNVSSGDGGHITGEMTLKNAEDGILVPKEKHVVLFHDAKDETVGIIDAFIKYAKERGFTILPLKQDSFICHFKPQN